MFISVQYVCLSSNVSTQALMFLSLLECIICAHNADVDVVSLSVYAVLVWLCVHGCEKGNAHLFLRELLRIGKRRM